MLRVLLNEKNTTLYKFEKASHICHATLNDIYNEKTSIEKCSASLLCKMSRSLNMDMDKVYSILSYDDLSPIAFSDSFDLFKSNVCHDLVQMGDKPFLKKHLAGDPIRDYYDRNMFMEALYLVSMIDYLCRKNDIPLPKEYDDIRQCKLDKLYVPKSVFLLLKSKSVKMSYLWSESIDTFLKHNILEANVYESR